VYVGEGGADVGRAPDIYLNERARAIAPVRITGNFGGEVLRGVRAFKPEERTAGLFCDDFLHHIRQTEQTYAALLRGHPTSFAVFKQGPWHNYGIVALEESQLALRSPFLDNDVVRTVFRAPASALASNEASLRLIASGSEALSRIPTDRGLGGGQGRVREFASRTRLELMFKAEYAYDMGMPQWLASLDHSLSALRLERLFLGRHKPFHFRVWYRDSLAHFVREVLLDPRSLSRPYLNGKSVQAIVEGHLAGTRNFTNEIHKVLTLELMHRLFLDDPENVLSSVGV
jgi:asparagine synthase (glutamine-hydrolysing)